MGDYYSGDPGFFSFLGKVAKTAVGFIPGVGGLAGKVLSKIPAPVRGIAGRVGGQIVKHPVLSAAGAAGAIGAGAGVMGRMGTARPGVGMRGAGGARGFGRKHRRMRVTNPKALRRALRRAYGFERLAMKTIHLLHPKKHVKFGGFKKRRRAK